jgi:hypothetical protein
MKGHNKGWHDVGVDDPNRAAQNRQRVAEGKTNKYYDDIRASVMSVPLLAPLPKHIPIGQLPEARITQKEEREDDDSNM